ncbi:UNVERIFIED_ORG: hypothetical protein JN05_05397 [Zoogloea ramigera]|uniref:Uncharacterized protein n=1 Tax=Duganella zoogloeoides TaxID=75659 RepID=A0ABZ0XXB4_9BURK|nr:hypothetical protein [Duganella zoogloeoides]WQH04299.1 hypothetical protein SR858_25210 [Duganella zoogloeoides]
MRSGAFYLLLYFHPIAKILLTIVCRVCGFLAVITLVGMFFNDSWVGIIVIAALFFLVSISASILQAKYTGLLLKLQPDETEYTFYD